MKMRVKSAFGQYRKGDIIEPSGVYRDRLSALGYIEPAHDVTAVSDEETGTRKRGRPRKLAEA